MKSLCLVSKEISAVSTPHLYRNLILPYHQEDPEWLSRSVESLARNKSLKYVRTITIGPYNFAEHGFCKAFNKFLPSLQNNSLTRFEYSSLGRLTHAQLKFLWQHQKNLRNMQFDFNLYSPTRPDILNEDAPTLRSLGLISELDIRLSSVFKEIAARRLLEILDLSRLQKLKIRASPDTSGAKRATFSDTFFTDHSLLTLTHLTLCLIDFDAQEQLQLGNYSSLTHLSVQWCKNLSIIFARYERPILKSLCFFGNCSVDPLEDDLVHMLHRFQGLETLALRVEQIICSATAECLRAAIGKHKDTLKYLLINKVNNRAQDSADVLMDSEFFEMIQKCKHISQLGLSMDVENVVENYKVITLEFKSWEEPSLN